MNTLKKMWLLIVIAVLAGCNNNSDRRIKLAATPSAGLMRDRVESITLAAAQKTGLAIFHFDNRTGRKDLEWLESGIVEMLNSNLAQARQLYIIPDAIVQKALNGKGSHKDILKDSTIAIKVAKETQSDLFICGAYEMKHDSLALLLELRDGRDGSLIHRAQVSGGGLENVFSMIDRAGRQLRGELQLTLREPRDLEFQKAEFATASLDAYKYFTQGLALVEQLKWNQAKTFFEKATQEDSTFAFAYYHLAHTEMSLGRMDQAREDIQRSIQYLDKVAPKERLYIESLGALLDGDIGRAGQLYQELEEKFPEDDEVHFLLGTFYFNIGNSATKAITHFEAAIALNPNKKLVYNMLGYCYEKVEKMDYAINAFKQYAKLAPDEANPHDSMGEVYLRKGRLDEAVKNFKIAIEKDENFMPSRFHLVSAYSDQGEYKKALNQTKIILNRAETTEERYQALMAQVLILTRAGKVETAKELALKAYQLDPFQYYAIAVLYELEKERQKAAQRLRRWIDHEKSAAGSRELGYDKLFAMASFALHINAEINRIEQLLDEYVQSKGPDVMTVAAMAYKQIINYQKGIFEPGAETLFSEEAFSQSVKQIPPIQWDVYWKYYFPSLKTVIQSRAMPPDFAKEKRDFAAQHLNQHFEIQRTYGVVMQYLLEGRLAEAKKELQQVGASLESNWQVFGPFHMTKGFDQKFWPEKKKTRDLLELQEAPEMIDITDEVTDGYIDLKKITAAGLNVSAYAVLTINTPASRTVQFRLGSNGPMKVWLNDELIYVKNLQGLATLDANSIPVTLVEGTNYLKVKVNSVMGDFGFYFRVTDEAGYGFYDISFGESLAT